MISFRVDAHADAAMRGDRATMVARLRDLLVGAVERVLPLLEFQGLEEELNREPENIEGEIWKIWEKRILTRLLFRMAEAVALQKDDFDSKVLQKTGDQLILDRRNNLKEHGGLKRKPEGIGREGNKRQKKDDNEQHLEAETNPASPSLLPDHDSQELDEEDHELVEVLAQMAEEARTPLVSDSCNPGVQANTDLATNLNQQPPGKNASALGVSAGASKNFEGTSDVIKDTSVHLAQTAPSLNPTPHHTKDSIGGRPPYVQRASSTPAMATQIDADRNRTFSNVMTPLPDISTSPGHKILPSRTPSLPAPSSEPWWASRKVKLKSKTSKESTLMSLHEVDKSIGGAENLETRSEMVQGVAAGNNFETEKNGEKEDDTGNESGEIARKEGEEEGSSSKGESGGKAGKSRAARRAEKRKLRREETPHA